MAMSGGDFDNLIFYGIHGRDNAHLRVLLMPCKYELVTSKTHKANPPDKGFESAQTPDKKC